MKLLSRITLQVLLLSFTLSFGFTSKIYADDTLKTITDTLTNLTCETQGVGNLLRSEFSHTCIPAPFFTFAVMNLVSPVFYMNTMLRLKINDKELFGTEYPGGQCARENRADPDNIEITFGLCSNLKLMEVRTKAVAESAIAIAKAVLTGTDPWDDIQETWKYNEAAYHERFTKKPGDSGTMWDLGIPTFWKVEQIQDRVCVGTYGFTGVVPVGCKYIKEPFPKSMYNNFIDLGDSNNSAPSSNDPTDPMNLVSCSTASGGGCYQKAYSASKTAVVITSPLIECIKQMIARLLISKDVCSFDDVNQVINSASRQTSSLFQFQVAMHKIVTALLTLYVIFFGFKIILSGEVPPKNEIINFILKIIFVTYFSIGINITPGSNSAYDRLEGMIQFVFPFLLDGINTLAGWVMNAAPSDLCRFTDSNISYDSDLSYIALWDAVDCRVAHYLGLDMLSTLLVENIYRAHDFKNFDFFSFSAPPYVYLLIPAILSGEMMLISIALSYPLLVISVAAFMVNATIMCMISIVILGILAPLFVPMFLFQYTRNYFDSWVKLLISFLLQPMVVVTFMITMFTVYDFGFYGECKYNSKLIHNSIEDAVQGKNPSRDVLIFYINNNWEEYTSEEEKSCKNSLGYMLNNPNSVTFDFLKDNVKDIVTSKPDSSKPGDVSTDEYLSKFEFLAGILLGPGMFFISPELVFEKIKDIVLALITACFTLYLMYNFSSQLAQFAADMTEGVALDNVTIKPQAIFKAGMAAIAASGGVGEQGLDQGAGKGGGVKDLMGGKRGGAPGNFSSGGSATDKISTSSGSSGESDLMSGSGGGRSTNINSNSSPSEASTASAFTASSDDSEPSSSTRHDSTNTDNDSGSSEASITSAFTASSDDSEPSSSTRHDSTNTEVISQQTLPQASQTPDEEPKIRTNEENKFDDLSEKINSEEITRKIQPELKKEPRVKTSTEADYQLDLSGDLNIERTERTAKARGLANDRVFTEQESHKLKVGELGYVKQEIRNAQIRDKKVAFDKETEELYRSGGGRARDVDNTNQKPNDKVERPAGMKEDISKKIDSGSDENS